MTGSPLGGDERRDQAGDAASIDRILEVLAHPLRRAVIDHFADADDRTVALDDLVDHVASADDRPEEPPARDRLLVLLYHQHLPQLADADVIEFDPRQGKLRYYPDDGVEEWLERIHEWEPDCRT